ncbi:MAG: protein kinase [Phycisphaerae bacterium]
MDETSGATDHHWERVQRAFHELLAQPQERRAAELERLSLGRAALRAELEQLLRADSGDGSDMLAQPLPAAAAAFDTALAASMECGRVVGAYQLSRLLGVGGMGAVYLGERVDGHFDQRVAIKLVRRGMESDEIVRRFRAERQLLAALEHPNIARLLDGGLSSDGRPYLVMEHVDGAPIDHYCKQRMLPLRDRLELFCGVCAAVQYAHQSLVVHRDLKPGNILVDGAGRPKLLDFGIAKVLREDDGLAVTRADARPMTPRYASPEQVRGERITTVSDVYAQGVILYELLSGCAPYQVATQSPEAYERAICDQTPPRPSTVVTDRALRKRMAGDLDTIVLKAMRKEPARRYQSAEQLADDIRRQLDGLPVRARPDTWRYRTAKFASRNPWLVAGAAAIVGGAIFSTIMYVRAASAREIAVLAQQSESEQRRAAQQALTTATQKQQISNAIWAFLDRLITQPNRGDPKISAVIDQAALELGNGEFHDQPLAEGLLRRTIGNSFAAVGRTADAEAQFQMALVLFRNLPTGEGREHAAITLNDWGFLASSLGNKAAAAAHYREAYESWQGREHDEFYTTLVNNLGEVYRALGRLDEAEPLLHESLELSISRNGPESFNTSRAYNNLGLLQAARHDFESAEANLRQGLTVLRRIQPQYVPLALNNLARVLEAKGDLDAAAGCYLDAVAAARRTDSNLPPTLALAGRFFAQRGDDLSAEAMLRECVALFQEQPEQRSALTHRILAWEALAEVCARKGEIAEAVALFEQTIELLCSAAPRDEAAISRLAQRLASLRGEVDDEDPAKIPLALRE